MESILWKNEQFEEQYDYVVHTLLKGMKELTLFQSVPNRPCVVKKVEFNGKEYSFYQYQQGFLLLPDDIGYDFDEVITFEANQFGMSYSTTSKRDGRLEEVAYTYSLGNPGEEITSMGKLTIGCDVDEEDFRMRFDAAETPELFFAGRRHYDYFSKIDGVSRKTVTVNKDPNHMSAFAEDIVDWNASLARFINQEQEFVPIDYTNESLFEVADNFDSKRKPMSSREREQHRGIYPYYGATSIIDYVDDYIFDDTYLLMGEDGTVKTDDGYPVLQYIWGKNWINNHAHVLKGKNISTELLMFALRKINIENIITGAVQPKINQENMNKIEFVIGPDSKNKELEVILKNLMDKSKNIIEENEKLSELRDTLLPKLMNGEIDLDNIEI